MHSNSVLGNVRPVTQSSYRTAIAGIVRSLQSAEGLTDQELADLIGVSAATIGNARNEKGDLNPIALLNIGRVFGPDAIGAVMGLAGCKAAPVTARCTSDASMPAAIARAQLFVCEALSDDHEVTDAEIVAPGASEAIDGGGQVFDTLRWRRDSLRARGRAA